MPANSQFESTLVSAHVSSPQYNSQHSGSYNSTCRDCCVSLRNSWSTSSNNRHKHQNRFHCTNSTHFEANLQCMTKQNVLEHLTNSVSIIPHHVTSWHRFHSSSQHFGAQSKMTGFAPHWILATFWAGDPWKWWRRRRAKEELTSNEEQKTKKTTHRGKPRQTRIKNTERHK